jgi:hypothetical protein
MVLNIIAEGISDGLIIENVEKKYNTKILNRAQLNYSIELLQSRILLAQSGDKSVYNSNEYDILHDLFIKGYFVQTIVLVKLLMKKDPSLKYSHGALDSLYLRSVLIALSKLTQKEIKSGDNATIDEFELHSSYAKVATSKTTEDIVESIVFDLLSRNDGSHRNWSLHTSLLL